MSEATIVGLHPWLPWPWARWKWLTEPVRAEPLAALRIGLAFTLLLDILGTYLPHAHEFFGQGVGSLELHGAYLDWPHWRWSLLAYVQDPWLLRGAVLLWALATLFLLLGFWTRTSALVVWLLSTSFANLNPSIDNAGDAVRGIILLYLPLCPCGAIWSMDSWLAQRRGLLKDPVFIYPWPLRLLFIQMVFIYFYNGMAKVTGVDWRQGNSLYYVLGDLTLARWSYAQVTIPYWLTRLLTWTVLVWEVSFPLLIWWRPLRIVALCFGAAFHIGIGLSLELGGFAPYMLCLYLPLLPWDRWADRWRQGKGSKT
jgi:hypothetical protein